MNREKDFISIYEFLREKCLQKITVNSKKKHWKKESLKELMEGLNDEIGELKAELFNIEYFKNIKPSKAALKKVLDSAIMECADCINYVLFIADKLKRKLDEN